MVVYSGKWIYVQVKTSRISIIVCRICKTHFVNAAQFFSVLINNSIHKKVDKFIKLFTNLIMADISSYELISNI